MKHTLLLQVFAKIEMLKLKSYGALGAMMTLNKVWKKRMAVFLISTTAGLDSVV